MDAKRSAEKALRDAVDADPTLKARYGDAWAQVSTARKALREIHQRRDVLDHFGGWSSELLSTGRTIVQLVAEKEKPNGERLPEYGDSRLESLLFDLYSPTPIENPMEVERIASALSYAAEQLGGDNALVKLLLNGKSPRLRAVDLVHGTKLQNVDFRRHLVDGGPSVVAACDDPIIRFCSAIDPDVRAVRKRYEDEVEAVERDAYAKIAAAQFAVKGDAVYPDATGTLRFGFGTVKGYREDDRDIPAFTDYAGLYRHWRDRDGPSRFEPPFYLTPRWVRAEKRLDLRTPLDFVLTADIIGGNSGSPVINRAGAIVGVIFDGNLRGLSSGYAYDATQARAVALDIRAITAALRDVYEAGSLVNEMSGADTKRRTHDEH
jgi:hypothetical protein